MTVLLDVEVVRLLDVVDFSDVRFRRVDHFTIKDGNKNLHVLIVRIFRNDEVGFRVSVILIPRPGSRRRISVWVLLRELIAFQGLGLLIDLRCFESRDIVKIGERVLLDFPL